MVDAFVFVYVSSVVAAMVKADASAFAEAEAVVAVVVRNWALRPVLWVPLYPRSDICVRLQRILSLFDRQQSTDREACRTTADSDRFSLRRRPVSANVYILCQIRRSEPTSWRLALFQKQLTQNRQHRRQKGAEKATFLQYSPLFSQ